MCYNKWTVGFCGYNKSLGKDAAMFKQCLTSNAIKMIAIVAMTVDHLAWAFFPGYSTNPAALFMHIIGRLTAPIMMFFIVEGYFHTRSVTKYIQRMFAFAVLSHFAYALMFHKNFIPLQNSVFDQTSVMWTFALGLTALAISKSDNPKLKPWHKTALIWTASTIRCFGNSTVAHV